MRVIWIEAAALPGCHTAFTLRMREKGTLLRLI